MNINSISALSSVYGGYYSPFGSGAMLGGAGTSVANFPDGAQVTTQRGMGGDIIAVTTASPAPSSTVPQSPESTVEVLA